MARTPTPTTDPTHSRLATAAIALVVGGGLGLLAAMGPLNPPAGPVASTYKTLTEVEPRIAINATNTPGDANSLFKITQPGSYYLTGNITGVANKHGVEIASSGVTLDLMGFDLLGVAGSLDGISTSEFGMNSIAIRNGSVRGWGDEGIDIQSYAPLSTSVADIRANNNAGHGIAVNSGTTVTRCSADSNVQNGINAGFGAVITQCAVSRNGFNGISAGTAATVTSCTAINNTINGISSSQGCTIIGCASYENEGSGILTSNGTTIVNCTARSNTLDGIAVVNYCVVLANTCSSNGARTGDGANIWASSTDNRIEGNTCAFADRGIEVSGSGNIILRNTCADNTINWVIAANNVCGPILDRTAPASAAISGNSAPDSTGSTHPNANFTY